MRLHLHFESAGRAGKSDAMQANVARMKQGGIRDGCLPGFHFIASGLLFLTGWRRAIAAQAIPCHEANGT